MRFSLGMFAAFALSSVSLFATNTTVCPSVGSNTNGCEYTITVTGVNGGGVATAYTVALSSPDQGPYDAVNTLSPEDTLIGVINNSGGPLTAITLPNTAGQFSFNSGDADGPCSGAFALEPAVNLCLGGVYHPQ